MNYEKNKEPKYNHFYFENEFVLIGVDKELEEEEVSIFEDSSLQAYGGLAEEILQLEDLKDRKVLFDTIDEFISKQKKKRDLFGVYWNIFVDFVLFIKKETLYDFSVALSRVIEGGYTPKALYDKLEKLKGSKGKPQAETLKLVELACYYMGITKEIVETGEGIWYNFEDNGKYTMKEIYEYCKDKWSQDQEIILKDMIRKITGVKDGEINEVPIRVWAKERLIDEKLKNFIQIIEQMNKKGL